MLCNFFGRSGLLEYWIRLFVLGNVQRLGLFSPAWDAVELILESWLNLSFRGF